MTENQNTAVEIDETELDVPTLEEIVSEIVVELDEYTPYKIATATNKIFEAVGLEKRIPTQMMYTYDKNGLIVSGKKSVKRYSTEEVRTWTQKYVSKQLNK